MLEVKKVLNNKIIISNTDFYNLENSLNKFEKPNRALKILFKKYLLKK